MRTLPEYLRRGDILPDGSTVTSADATIRETTATVTVRHPNGEHRIRDFTRGRSLEISRPRGATFGPTGQGLPLEDDRANAASDAYETRLGL